MLPRSRKSKVWQLSHDGRHIVFKLASRLPSLTKAHTGGKVIAHMSSARPFLSKTDWVWGKGDEMPQLRSRESQGERSLFWLQEGDPTIGRESPGTCNVDSVPG